MACRSLILFVFWKDWLSPYYVPSQRRQHYWLAGAHLLVALQQWPVALKT